MKSCALALLDAFFAVAVVVHCIEIARIASIEYLVIVLSLKFWFRVVASESRHPISLITIQRLIFFLFSTF